LLPIPLLVLSGLYSQAVAAGSNGAAVAITTNNAVRVAYSSNVIVNSSGGDPTSVVVIGAHLDSVAAGPGINDNGSGSATILAIAVELARLKLTPVNQVRFIFFGAEEKGLLGSTYYASHLQDDEKFQLALMVSNSFV
jgi:Zn-dependent M28 family amino/carboxypeptidase